MRYFLLLINFIFLIAVNAQNSDVYPLHPSVGDTIDVTEKLDYSLFSEIENKGFQFAAIVYDDEKFKLLIVERSQDLETGLEIESQYTSDLTQEQIIEEQKKIEKINAYYRLMAEEKLKEKEQPETYRKSTKKYPIRLEGARSEKMKKEARMNVRLKEDNRRQQEFEMGLRPRRMLIEFR